MLGLDAEERAPVTPPQPVRGEGRCALREALDRSLDGEAALVDRGDMIGDDIDQDDRMAGTREVGSDRPADRAGAPDQEGTGILAGRHAQGPSITSRVSSTATFQRASISSSGRW